MSRALFEEFIAKFGALKRRVNSNPLTLGWLAKEEPDLGALALEVQNLFTRVATYFAKSLRPFTVRPPPALRGALIDYRDKWETKVSEVGYRWLFDNLDKFIEVTSPNDGAVSSPPPKFDPLRHDASKEVYEIFAVADSVMQTSEGEDLGDGLHIAFGAWDFFRDTVGIDLAAIHQRWKEVPHHLIPEHVANNISETEPGGLYDLLSEASRAYVFGLHGAALAMCRAITEIVLTTSYGVSKEEGGLKSIIMIAEHRHPWMKRLKLGQKKRLADEVLHEGRSASEQAVLAYLKDLNELIEKSPPLASRQ